MLKIDGMNPFRLLILLLILSIPSTLVIAQNKMTKDTRLKISRISKDFPVTELQNKNWDLAKEVSIQKYWSAKPAPEGRHATARLLWSDTAIYIRFEANQDGPLVISDPPNLATKTNGLWDRDVCEIFIAPDRTARNKYFEFEIAPNGEWIDLGIEVLRAKRKTDWDYRSGMESAVVVGDKKVVMAVKIGWKALGKTPAAGDIWLGNLFRCVGRDPTRGYLAWQPTKTKTPSFHVPNKFGEFEFVK
jgi:hypothetical protein